MVYTITFITIIILIFVNGITDAPNAIATLVGTKVMPFKKATYMSAFFNVLGIVVMSFVNLSVADCISDMVNFTDETSGMMALCIAMISVILFSLIALMFGIPTSESHGLIAGLTGSAIALGGFSAVSIHEWKNVMLGLLWSVIGCYALGIIVFKLFSKPLTKWSRDNLKKAQILSACGMSFMHGAQDGLKFIGVLVIFTCVYNNMASPSAINPLDYIWAILLCSVVMFVGVSIGGKKIVQNIGKDMVSLNNNQALCSDITTILTLLLATLNRLPVSTTHAKTVAILSAGNEGNKKVNMSKVMDIVKAWVWTFPVCGGISFILTYVIIK